MYELYTVVGVSGELLEGIFLLVQYLQLGVTDLRKIFIINISFITLK